MKENYTIKELPISERPYEKCEQYGAISLSDAELLAVIIRSGTKKERAVEVIQKLLSPYPEKGLNILHHLTLKELTSVKGIGKVKAIQLQCVAELTKRMHRLNTVKGMRFTSPDLVANYYMEELRHLPKEIVYLVCLDSKSQLMKDLIISSGTVNSSILPQREIFLTALKYEAVSIIILHNHPSGDPTPSKEDIQVTKRLKEAGNLIGIKLVDHIIIGDNTYISLNETGLL